MIDSQKDFKESPYGKTWNDVVDSRQFQEAAKAALLSHARVVAALDTNTAGLKTQGAQEFLRLLMHLCDTPKAPAGVSSSLNLSPTK